MNLLGAMRAFTEIVDRGSLTAAAEALDRSQPSMVRTLAALEERLGVRLLNRTTRRMSLTPEGRDYLARCRRILADVEDAERSVGRQQSEPRGDLRLTAPILFGEMYVAPAVIEFLRRYREVRVDLLLFDRNLDLVEEGIDLAVRIGHLADSTLVAMRVGTVTRVVCASPAFLEQTGEPTHPKQLADSPCIRFSGLSSPGTWTFREHNRDVSVQVGGNMSCNHLSIARAACVHGLGFGRFLSYQVEPFLSDGSLQRVLRAYEPDPLPVSLVYPSARLTSTRVRAMIGWLQAFFQEHAAAG